MNNTSLIMSILSIGAAVVSLIVALTAPITKTALVRKKKEEETKKEEFPQESSLTNVNKTKRVENAVGFTGSRPNRFKVRVPQDKVVSASSLFSVEDIKGLDLDTLKRLEVIMEKDPDLNRKSLTVSDWIRVVQAIEKTEGVINAKGLPSQKPNS